MIRKSLIAGSAKDWAWALGVADRSKRKLPLQQQNWILDALIVAQDAEDEARKIARERLPTRRPMRRLRP
jgi:hypothetical protein